jgi:hypothetical protein
MINELERSSPSCGTSVRGISVPRIDVFSLAETVDAYRYIEQPAMWKIVVSLINE